MCVFIIMYTCINVYIYIYIYIYIHTYIHTYIHILCIYMYTWVYLNYVNSQMFKPGLPGVQDPVDARAAGAPYYHYYY